MTVSELIEKLQTFDPTETVYFHCNIKEKSPEFDGPFFEAREVIRMGRVVIFEA